jgi:hypothetical protein
LAGEYICLVEQAAPEISKSRCNTELAKGVIASGRLRQLLKGSVAIDRSGRTDRYHRTLASLVAPQGNVADILIQGSLLPTSWVMRPAGSALRIGARNRAGGSAEPILALSRAGEGQGRVLARACPARRLRRLPEPA